MTTSVHSLDTLPALAQTLLTRAGAGIDAPVSASLRIAQLRRKPGRGLVASLVPPTGPRMWLRLEETALQGAGVSVSPADLLTAPLRGAWPGSLHADTAGVALEPAGIDAGLAALAPATSPLPGSSLWAALEGAARDRLHDPRARLTSVDTTVVRHKPGSRCVLRYALTAVSAAGAEVRVGVFGKLFADPANATSADRLLRALHDEQAAAGRPSVPRPLGALDSLGVALTAAVGDGGAAIPGTAMLRPPHIHAGALAAAASALGALHRSAVTPPGGLRTSTREAETVRRRVAILAEHTPSLAADLRATGAELARLLDGTVAASSGPAHGGFKPSQLVYTDARRVAVTDFDGLCTADPALDLGYFLAYLRPASLWRDAVATRAWFDSAAAVFTTAYARSMLETGTPAAEVAGTLRRAPLHEAAALLKIAGRRPNRCNAPRPAELAAMLREIDDCVARMRHATATAAA